MEKSLYWDLLLFVGSFTCLAFALVILRRVYNIKSALKKYVDYAGYKHLDIEFTSEEIEILKNLEK